MNPKEKSKFQEAVKQYDNKEYKNAKRTCDKILEKSPTNEDAMALKGLVLLSLDERDEGEKLIKAALKLNFKSATVWQFYAIFNKEIKNYTQAIKCYNQANKKDPTNFNVVRDSAYLELFLREFASFEEYSRKAIDLKPNLFNNWIQYSFALFINGKYKEADVLIDSCDKNQTEIKKANGHEICLYKAEILCKQNKYEECINYLISNISKCIDMTKWYEKIVNCCLKLQNKNDVGLEYVYKLFEINSENANYYSWYFILKMREKNVDLLNNLTNYDKLLKAENIDSKIKEDMYNLINSDLKNKINKSRVLTRIEMAYANEEQFKNLFNDYLINGIENCFPTFAINLKFIYKNHPEKVKIISEILSKHLESVKNNNQLDSSLSKNNKIINDITSITWLYFYYSSHCYYLTDLENAYKYIETCITNLPSVNEFYMLKAKILGRGYYLDKVCTAMSKARKLDLGDRYLNAMHAKTFLRLGDVDKANSMMEKFSRNPLTETNLCHYQTMEYQKEASLAYLKELKILNTHRIIKETFNNFNDIIEDQNDFYLYCIRRFMLNDLYNLINFMGKINGNKYFLNCLNLLDLIRSYLSCGFIKDDEIIKEFDEMEKKYEIKKYKKFEKVSDLIASIDKDIYDCCKKIQNLTTNPQMQFLCVKYYLLKNKILLALKSFLCLNKTCPKHFYTYLAGKLIKEYYTQNSKNINETTDQIFKENFKIDQEFKDYQCDNLVDKLMFDLYQNGKYGDVAANEGIINEFLNKVDKKTLRATKSSNINTLNLYISLFTNVDYRKKFQEKLFNIMKIDGLENDDKICQNLKFYEDKEWEERNLFLKKEEESKKEEEKK